MQETKELRGTNVISEYTIAEMWDTLVQEVDTCGDEVSPRGIPTRELTNIALEYPGFRRQYTFKNPIRKINQLFAPAELFYFLNGRDDDLLLEYVPAMASYVNPYTHRFDGSYGPALYHGLPKALNILQQDKNSRRAVIPILRLDHLDPSSLDIPCNDLLALRIRNDKLDMNIVTRSQDLYRGFIYDTLEFQLLQFLLAQALEVEVGTYGHYLFSLHLYENDLVAARNAVGNTAKDIGNPNIVLRSVPEFWDFCRDTNEVLSNKEEFKRAVRMWRLLL